MLFKGKIDSVVTFPFKVPPLAFIVPVKFKTPVLGLKVKLDATNKTIEILEELYNE